MNKIRKYIPFKSGEVLQRKYLLKGYDIETFSSWIDAVLKMFGTERQNSLRIRLSMEEAILRYRDRFGENTEFTVTAARQRYTGRPYIQIELEEEAYNSLSGDASEIYDWSGSLLTAVGLHPQYSYSNGKNVLKVILPNQTRNMPKRAAAAIILGIIIGFIGSGLSGMLSGGNTVTELYSLIFDSWTRILNLLSGPVIFFTTITTVLGTGKIASVGGNSRHVLLRYFMMSLLAAMLAVAAVIVVFGIRFNASAMETPGLHILRDIIASVIPNEIFSPFMESNTPQLLFVAFVIGSVLNAIGAQADDLSHLIKQINMVGLVLTEWVGMLVPSFTCILIALEIMEGRLTVLNVLPLCLLTAFVISTSMLLGVIFYVRCRMGVPFLKLIRKLRQSFVLTVRTGSLNAAIGQTENCCINELGIDRSFTTVSLAYGWILYLPASIIGTLIFTLNIAQKYGVQGGVLWMASAVILSVFLFVATPPVPGANLLAFAVIFSALGIPGEALTDAMVFDIVFGIYSAAVNQALLQMELVLQAHKIRILDTSKLIK